ncbi:tail fiber domain-containing protein [Sphingobium sp. YR768]|uniref:tail fiber domain-containing protein n=1 Tax=Sphingobium sp. YR768 TaxID=1884365 RepID=UPI0008C951CA|nr:tail fiber domain-containing protein [Sphingobium sp. YR768]SES08586.1 hypothetical protein SAMN05518866_13741 [Sphingobium sp. YR768]
MGLSSSKTTTGPSKQALPYLKAGSSAVQSAYDSSKGVTADVTNALQSSFDNYSVSNPTLNAANSYTTDVLSGKYLDAGNPYLQGVIDDTNASVSDQINALFSKAGQTGSSRQVGELGKQLASAENNLRYSDYNNQLSRMDTAANTATSLNSANNANYATQASLGSTLNGIPMQNATDYANALASLWGNSTTTKQSAGIGQMLLQAAGAAAGAYAASEPTLKTNVEYLGEGAHGLNVYAFDYITAPNDAIAAFMPTGRQIGVMADEVALLRPDALGPTIGGYRTVDYGAL